MILYVYVPPYFIPFRVQEVFLSPSLTLSLFSRCISYPILHVVSVLKNDPTSTWVIAAGAKSQTRQRLLGGVVDEGEEGADDKLAEIQSSSFSIFSSGVFVAHQPTTNGYKRGPSTYMRFQWDYTRPCVCSLSLGRRSQCTVCLQGYGFWME